MTIQKLNVYQIEKMSNVTVTLNRQQKPSLHDRVKALKNISITSVRLVQVKMYK